MSYDKLEAGEKVRRREIVAAARKMITELLSIENEDEVSHMAVYRNFYLQISFSELHPLMVLCFAKALDRSFVTRLPDLNIINQESVLGCHMIHGEAGCYCYRVSHWLDSKLTPLRFFELLNRHMAEAERGFFKICGSKL